MSSRKKYWLTAWIAPLIVLVLGALWWLNVPSVQHRQPVAGAPVGEDGQPAPSEARLASSGGPPMESPPGPAAGDGAGDQAGRRAPEIAFRLLDASTGRPLAREKASVFLRNRGYPRTSLETPPPPARPSVHTDLASLSAEVETDAGGRFTVRGLRPGTYSMTTRHPDYLADVRSVEVPASSSMASGSESTGPPGSAQPAEVEIPLRPGTLLLGEVVTTEGKPIAGAFVKLSFTGGAALEGTVALAEEDGKFAVRGLRDGSWKVSAGARGFRRRTVSVDLPADGPIRIELRDDPGFSVRVLDESGRPLGGARVFVIQRTEGIPGGRSSGTTDGAGKVYFQGLPDGADDPVSIEARQPGYVSKQVTPKAAEFSRGPLEIALARGREISGRVLDASEKPVANADVRLVDASGSVRRTLKTATSGEFAFRGTAEGRYAVLATTPDRGFGRLEGLELGGLSEDLKDLKVSLMTGEGLLAGKVLDEQGNPQSLCRVELSFAPQVGEVEAESPVSTEPEGEGEPEESEKVSATAGLPLRTVTDAGGRFRFGGLPFAPGTPARLAARGSQRTWVRDFAAAVGQEDIVLRVSRTGSIRCLLTLKGPAGAFTIVATPEAASEGPESGARRDGTGAARERRFRFSGNDRSCMLHDIAPGTYTLKLLVGDEILETVAGVQVLPGTEAGPVEL